MNPFNHRRILSIIGLVAVCFAPLSAGQTPATPSESTWPKPSSRPTKVYRAGSDGVPLPSCYYMPNPPYTQKAKDAKYQGTVLAEGTITVEGKIEDTRILLSPGLGLDESIMETMKKWKCKPVIGPGGKPVRVIASFKFDFSFY